MDGIVYVAFGDQYICEAIESSRSVRVHSPNLQICLISDSSVAYPDFDAHISAARHRPVIRGKLEMFNSPYDRTLFLDTDTEVFAPLDEVFSLLDKFDIVFQQTSTGYHYQLDGVPNTFPEPNTGVIGFKKSPRLLEFARLWAHYFDQYVDVMGREWDQRSFRHAIYESMLRFAVLPTEYNFMTYDAQFAMTEMKIVHGRPAHARTTLAARMNEQLGPRVHVPRIGCIGHYNQMPLRAMVRISMAAAAMIAVESAKRSVRGLGLYPIAQSVAAALRRRPRARSTRA